MRRSAGVSSPFPGIERHEEPAYSRGGFLRVWLKENRRKQPGLRDWAQGEKERSMDPMHPFDKTAIMFYLFMCGLLALFVAAITWG